MILILLNLLIVSYLLAVPIHIKLPMSHMPPVNWQSSFTTQPSPSAARYSKIFEIQIYLFILNIFYT